MAEQIHSKKLTNSSQQCWAPCAGLNSHWLVQFIRRDEAATSRLPHWPQDCNLFRLDTADATVCCENPSCVPPHIQAVFAPRQVQESRPWVNEDWWELQAPGMSDGRQGAPEIRQAGLICMPLGWWLPPLETAQNPVVHFPFWWKMPSGQPDQIANLQGWNRTSMLVRKFLIVFVGLVQFVF